MKMTALEVIFWFPLKSFSSLKCILLNVLIAFQLCFKANHKGCVASVEFCFFLFFFEKKLFHVMQKRVIPSQPQAWEASEPAFNWRNFFRIIMGLADYSFLSFFSPSWFEFVLSLRCGFPNFIFILHMLFQTGEMFMNNASLFS